MGMVGGHSFAADVFYWKPIKSLFQPNHKTDWPHAVDQSRGALQQVSYTHSGFPWMGIVALKYDPALACLVAAFKPGAQAAIQENEFIYVWAVGRDGLYSAYYPAKVGWDFCQ